MISAVADRSQIRATYRLQFHEDFTFRDATALVPYLAELGISHLYASPLTEARPGSTHGYDIVDHNRLNPEIGSDADFKALIAELHRHEMGLIIDFVPNHMGIGPDNAWWFDVLEFGEDSPYASYFDIDWDPVRTDQKGRVLVPILGDQYGVILEKGEITLRFDAAQGSFDAWYYDHRFPISPHSYPEILAHGGAVLAEHGAAFSALKDQPAATAWQQANPAKRRLAEHAQSTEVAAVIQAAIGAYAGKVGSPTSFRPLHHLLEAQNYRLADWHVAAEEINYRRFFNINELAGLRIELPSLFDETHRLAFTMIEGGELQGLRIDHIDGLFDPAGYCQALRERWGPSAYITVEKILAHYEHLPDWPIAGTTGYDFIGQVTALFVDAANEEAMSRQFRRLTGRAEDFDAILYAAKQRIMRINLASEMNVLAHRFHRLAIADWRTRDFTLEGMRAALQDIIAGFPVYRTYVSERGCSSEDRRFIEWAVAQARKHSTLGGETIFDFIYGVLIADLPGHPHPQDVLRRAMQFQQVTGPVMAKSFEDTAFYRYSRLLALNEVGNDPRRFGISPAAFHHSMTERARQWPRAIVTTATHDTKRGEDARMRIALLSEMPQEWGRRVRNWQRLNRRHRNEVDGEAVPGRDVEYIFYQTLVGAWPTELSADDVEGMQTFAQRVDEYMIKAVREGKEHSGWSYPKQDYEAGLQRFVRGVLDASRPNPFLIDFAAFIAELANPAAIASLSQLTLKLTVPGVADVYQGGELWDFSMVDPDNRRPVDFAYRRKLLEGLEAVTPRDLAAHRQDGREKLHIIRSLLGLRRQHPALFLDAEYQPLEVIEGTNSDRLCAFARHHDRATLAIVVPRLTWGLYRGGAQAEFTGTDIVLPAAAQWRHLLTGATVAGRDRIDATTLLADYPIAVLFTEN